MKIYRIIIEPKSSIKFSMSKFPTSDTLFGALCWGIRMLYGEKVLKDLLKDFITENFEKNTKLFVLSSVYPVMVNEEIDKKLKVFFYPFPLMPDCKIKEIEEIANLYYGKNKNCSNFKCNFGTFKNFLCWVINNFKEFKCSYVSESVFIDILEGVTKKELFNNYLELKINKIINCNELGDNLIIKIGDMILKNVEYKKIFNQELEQINKNNSIIWNIARNKVDRINNSSSGAGQIYYSSEVFVSSKLKLYFIISTGDIYFLNTIFKFLSDTGIGGDRSIGKGLYIFSEPEEIILPCLSDEIQPNFFTNLSLYIPKVNEINFNEKPLFYDIMPYRSVAESEYFRNIDIWKDKIIYFKEGSIFPLNNISKGESTLKKFYGKLMKLKEIEGNDILQNGITIPIFGKMIP